MQLMLSSTCGSNLSVQAGALGCALLQTGVAVRLFCPQHCWLLAASDRSPGLPLPPASCLAWHGHTYCYTWLL